jgi:predicted phage terminase large subunit-like protein
MSFEISDADQPEWIFCPTCHTDRELSTLDDRGTCPHCGEIVILDGEPIKKLEIPVPDTKNITPVGKRTKKEPLLVQNVAQNDVPLRHLESTSTQDQADAMLLPFEAPTPSIDPDIQRELASRALCRRRLMPFIKKFRRKYEAGWVHEDICRRLEQFLKDVEAGLSPRLLLMMPPRAGKSEIGSRHFPPWVMGIHPDWEIIAASHTSSLTMSFSRYVRDLVRDPVYSAIFPTNKLDPSSQSIENWNTTAGGGYLAAGVGTGITGRGAHILLLDDLVKDMEAADSQTIRDNTWEWYVSTAYTRLAPGAGVIGIMTWWHDDDWAGRIQQVMATGDGDKFEIIKYPAINETGDEYRLPDNTIKQFAPLETALIPDGSVLTRPHNTAIHPARYTTQMMLRIKANMYASGQQRVWNSLYQQNPAPDDGLFFTKDMFRYYSSLPARENCHVYQAWDFAITENTASDYTVGATIYQDENDAIYVVDICRFKSGDSFFIIDQMLDYAAQWGVTLLGVEDGQIWKAMQSLFDKRVQERKMYTFTCELLKPLTDKMVRASPLRGRMQQGKVYFDEKAPWFRELFMEMTR